MQYRNRYNYVECSAQSWLALGIFTLANIETSTVWLSLLLINN